MEWCLLHTSKKKPLPLGSFAAGLRQDGSLVVYLISEGLSVSPNKQEDTYFSYLGCPTRSSTVYHMTVQKKRIAALLTLDPRYLQCDSTNWKLLLVIQNAFLVFNWMAGNTSFLANTMKAEHENSWLLFKCPQRRNVDHILPTLMSWFSLMDSSGDIIAWLFPITVQSDEKGPT